MKDKIRDLIMQEVKAIMDMPISDSFERAIYQIYYQVHLKGGKLVCSGMGKAGQIALNIATTFSSTGTCAVYLHPSEAQHGDLGILREDDILLLISNSGKTREVLELVHLARNIYPNIKIIAITGQDESELAEEADITLLTGNGPEICPLGLTPTTSTTLMTIIGDILVVSMMDKIKFTKEQYSRFHHSGYLGSKSRGEE